MMEKPLAVSMKHARAIEAAAKKGGIQMVVNYETTWYPANHAAYALVQDQSQIGDLRKIVVHDGHQGPKEIGCSRRPRGAPRPRPGRLRPSAWFLSV